VSPRLTSLFRAASFVTIGGGGFVLGLILQWLFVHAGMSIIVAYTTQLAITTWLNYELNRRITWKDRTHNTLSAMQFLASRIMISATSWVLFIVLSEMLHINHLLANAISVLSATLFNYRIGDRIIFRTPVPETETSQS
jgi:putative flippase GtrA